MNVKLVFLESYANNRTSSKFSRFEGYPFNLARSFEFGILTTFLKLWLWKRQSRINCLYCWSAVDIDYTQERWRYVNNYKTQFNDVWKQDYVGFLVLVKRHPYHLKRWVKIYFFSLWFAKHRIIISTQQRFIEESFQMTANRIKAENKAASTRCSLIFYAVLLDFPLPFKVSYKKTLKFLQLSPNRIFLSFVICKVSYHNLASATIC